MNLLRRNKGIVLLLILMLFFVSGCSSRETKMDAITKSNIESINKIMEADKLAKDTKEPIVESTEPEEKIEDIKEDEIEKKIEGNIVEVSGTIEVHYIDVGQGDSILIKQGNNNMLIDAGDNHYGQIVVDYLRVNGVDTLDYVISTHPHADHIGALDNVIKTFNIGKVIMPKVTHTTQTFEDVIMAIKNKGLKITTPIVGDVYKLGDAKFTILAPNQSSYSNLNDYSVVTKLEYGNNAFIFTGDAETQAETEVVNNGLDIKADVLKVSHHGSDTSTISNFLNKVKPSFAVITIGAGNKYGHPDNLVINRLEENNINIYRSDLHGTIIATGDGTDITFDTKTTLKAAGSSTVAVTPKTEEKVESKLEPENTKPEDNIKYIGNKNSKIFHNPNCSSLPADKNRVTFNSKEEAINAGHRACKRCKP